MMPGTGFTPAHIPQLRGVATVKPHKVRITVLRNSFNQEFVDAYAEDYKGQPWKPCGLLHEGQEFISDGWMPEGFCSHAWTDILRYVLVLARGGNFLGVKPGMFVTCCTDGFRPVFLKVERIDEAGETAAEAIKDGEAEE